MVRSKGRMTGLSKGAVDETNRELSEVEAALLLSTEVDLESLRPQVTETETYDQLIEIIKQSTADNEDLAQLNERIKTLGQEGWKVTKKVIKIISELT